MDFTRVIGIVFGVMVIMLAIKLLSVIGIFATVAFALAGLNLILHELTKDNN